MKISKISREYKKNQIPETNDQGHMVWDETE